MRVALRVLPVVFACIILPWIGVRPAAASGSGGAVYLLTVDGATLGDLLATPALLGLARAGGAALVVMNGSGDVLTDLSDGAAASSVSLNGSAYGFGSVAGQGGSASLDRMNAAAKQLEGTLRHSTSDDAFTIVVADPDPSNGGVLGGVVVAQGSPADLLDAMNGRRSGTRPVRTLTSDSTRRDGVVTSADLVESGLSVAGLGDRAFTDGSKIRGVDAAPPTGLYVRYLQYRRLTVPIGTAAALYVTLGGVLAILALGWRRSPRWLRTLMAWIAISSPVLALALLLVGHLPSLTTATVVGFLIAVTALGTLALVPVARRKGTLTAIAVAGAGLLIAFAIEAAVGWTAALTPMLGGSQLDGGRFFGLPNAFIGLLLGGSVYVAQRLPRAWGTALIVGVGLFAGSPWTGSNIGAAITLFAGAGIWWGLRGELRWTRTLAAAAITVVAGTGLVVLAHRFLTNAPTHITRFAESTGGIGEVWHKLIDRLGVGVDLIKTNPAALVPVIGVIATLVLVLRPIPPVRITFVEAPVWKAALLTIVIASLVAYAVNDSGAAAIGEGFTTSFGALLYVSLLRRNGIMEAA